MDFKTYTDESLLDSLNYYIQSNYHPGMMLVVSIYAFCEFLKADLF